MLDVGDISTLTLTLTVADVTTTATVALVSVPAGVTPPALTATPNAARTIWTAPLLGTAAGAWKAKWTVTGTGQGVEFDTVYFLDLVGSSYATLSHYVTWLGADPPNGSARLLIRASAFLDGLLVGAVYPVTAGLPTAAVDIAALRDATCAQVEYWQETGDTTGSGATGSWSDVQIGSVKLSGRTGGATGDRQLAPSAADILHTAGLLPVTAWAYG